VQSPILTERVPSLYFDCGFDGTELAFDRFLTRTGFDRVLLQAYPSGGCDLFVNALLVARSRPPRPRPWPDSVRIAVGGRTYRTDMLIGTFRITRGIVAPAASR
jgi:hypothetical protein